MERSEINNLMRAAERCFVAHGWALPPNARWDVTDFGLGAWRQFGLVLINLAEEPEYCEKLMYAQGGMRTPAHCHRSKRKTSYVLGDGWQCVYGRGDRTSSIGQAVPFR